MISPELRARIRRLFFAEHWKIGTIAAELGLHRDTVALAVEVERFTNVAFRPAALLLDPYKDFVRATLEQHPRLRATRLLQMIQGRGYTGSVWPLRRFIRQVRPVGAHEAFFRLSMLPGEQGQVDWGSFGSIAIGNTRRWLWCFVMVLSFSRALFARFVLDQTLESFLRCHHTAFVAFQGVPRGILYDNLKAAVLERVGDVIRFNPRLLEFAGHYHFAPRPVARARGNEKGRVERAIRYLRDSFFAARAFRSIDDLNAQLEDWIDRLAHARLVPGDADKRSVAIALAEERPRLLPLPAHPFDCDAAQTLRSGKTPSVRCSLSPAAGSCSCRRQTGSAAIFSSNGAAPTMMGGSANGSPLARCRASRRSFSRRNAAASATGASVKNTKAYLSKGRTRSFGTKT